MRLICVNGMGRAGTTALAAALGGGEGVEYVGELRWLMRDLSEDRVCTCGRAAEACPRWSQVLRAMTSAGWSRGDRWWWCGPVLLDALAESSGASVIVDSSKGLRAAARMARWGDVSFVWCRRPWAGGDWLRRAPTRVEQRGFSPLAARAWYAARGLEVSTAQRIFSGPVVDHDELLRRPKEVVERLCEVLELPRPGDLSLRFPHVLTANRCRFLGGRRLGDPGAQGVRRRVDGVIR